MKLQLHLLPIVAFLFAASCASLPEEPLSEAYVKVTRADTYVLNSRGVPPSDDPFIPNSPLLSTRYDFIVYNIEIGLPSPAEIEISASARNPEGKQIATLYSKEDLHKYWESTRQTSKDIDGKLSNINKFYFTSFKYKESKKRSSNIMLLAGKAPLPRPSEIRVDVSIDGTIHSSTFLLEASKSK